MNPASVNRTDREYNVCFQGSSLDVGNLGCCALTISFIKLVINSKPNARIHLLYGNRTGGVQNLQVSDKKVEVDIVNFRLSPKARINEHLLWILLLALIQRIIPINSLRNKIIQSNRWLRTLETADFVGEIRGGDSFSDIYGLRRFLIGIVPCIIDVLMQKKLVLLPQTYGPFKSKIAKYVAGFIIGRADRIFARDRGSIEFLKKTFIEKTKNKNIEFCPDFAFTMEPILPDRIDIQPELDRNNAVPLIGLNISGLLYVGGFTRNNMFGLSVDYKHFVHVLLKELLEQTKAHVLLVPHVFWGNKEGDELQICRRLSKSMGEKYAQRLHLVDREYNQNETKGIIGLCDFFIGSRMHACIAALSQCVPAIGLAYSKKFEGVFRSVGTEQLVVDMRREDTKEIIKKIITAFEKRNTISSKLKEIIPNIQRGISDAVDDMLRGVSIGC
jgi:colanic acid/amylovoran biosynthesis protein